MPRLTLCSLGLLGIALVAPPGAEAGAPAGCPGCVGGQHAHASKFDPSVVRTSGAGHYHAPATPGAPSVLPGGHAHGQAHEHGARCMCPDCQVKRAIEQAEGAPVVILGQGPGTAGETAGAPCTSCQGTPAEMPGHASLRGGAPGYASLSGAPASGEPTPIGVVQTNYMQSPPSAPAFGGPAHGYGQAPAGMPGMHMPHGGPPQAAVPPAGPWLASRSAKRPSLLRNFIGYGGPLSRRREAREAQRASDHASIPMGMSGNTKITELPASMVYGR